MIARSRRLDGERIRELRRRQELSQSRLAELLKAAGDELGEPNGCSKRLIQKWESGQHATISPAYQRALQHLTGLHYTAFCEPRPLLMPPDGQLPAPQRLTEIIDALTDLRDQLAA